MQLLQMWLQTFQEPILSLPLQQAVAAMLCPAPYSTTSDVLHSAVNSTAKSAVDFPLHDISIYMAVVQRLTAQQQFVVARLLTCVQVVRNGSRESSSLEALVSKLLQWLTRHLTGCCTTGSLSSSKEAAAVLHFLDCCLCDTVVMRLLTSSKASVTARAIQEQSSTSVSTQAASPAKQLAFPQLHQTARGSKEEDATAYSDSNDLEESKDDDSIQAYKLPITHHASEPPTSQTEMRKTQGPSLVDAGCPCFSSRLAKMVFAKAM